ncbi:MAG: GYF domain-containing protein, partial [Planctomycetia bacterium]|nr:GYF domain-containing protein [Planctomycetia bacterium]
MLYYAKIRGRMCGPFPVETVLEMISRGQIGRTSQVSPDGTNWCLAGQREDLFPAEHQSELPGGSPAASASVTLSATRQWYVSNDGKTGTGPYSQQEISSLYQKQQFYADSLVWMDGVNPVPLKSSPDFAFLFQASQGTSEYSAASTTGMQPGSGFDSGNSNPYAQGNNAATNTPQGLSGDVLQVMTRPSAWILTINLFLSLGIIAELILYILAIRALTEQKLHGGAVAGAVLGLFIVFAFSVWIAVEHWR